MVLLLSALILGTAAFELRAESTGSRRGVYVFKPLTTALILLLALLAPEPTSPFYQGAIVLGLAFSLGGDVLLMLPRDRFLAGLTSFLVAHLCYFAAFASQTGFALSLWLLLPFLLLGLTLLLFLWPFVGASLRLPVVLYALVIVVMAWQAFVYWQVDASTEALLACLGAFLFVISDAVLAINRFAVPFRGAHFIIMSTYYAAQWMMALSV